MSQFTRLSIAIALTALVSCGGGGSTSTSPVPAPSNLSISGGVDFDHFSLSWTPVTEVDGYYLEMRLNNGVFARASKLIPASVQEASLHCDSTTPELTTFGVRLQSSRGGTLSAYSNLANYLRGLRFPGSFNANISRQNNTFLTWEKTSSAATSILLERLVFDSSSNVLSQVTLPVFSVDTTSYLDPDFKEGLKYEYHCRYKVGSIESAIAAVSVGPVIYAPTNLVTLTTVSGIQLSWTNWSLAATQIHVLRQGEQGTETIAVLSPETTNFIDTTAPAGLVYYKVVARLNDLQGESALCQAVSIDQEVTDFPVLTAELQHLPTSMTSLTDLGRDPQGVLGLVGNAIYQGHPDAWSPPGAYHSIFTPGMSFDATGHAHTMQIDGTDLLHRWFDGSVWREEIAATSVFVSTSRKPRFVVSPEGVIHAVWGDESNLTHAVVMHATNESGAWRTNYVNSLSSSGFIPFLGDMKLSPDGTLNLLLTDGDFILARRSTLGEWSKEIMPSSPGLSASIWYSALVPLNDHRVLIYYLGGIQGPGGWFTPWLCEVERTDQGFGIANPLMPHPIFSGDSLNTFQAVATLDGQKRAVLILASPGMTLLWKSSSSSVWTSRLVGTPQIGGLPEIRHMSLDSSGKVHILVAPWTYIEVPELANLIHYTEVPQ